MPTFIFRTMRLISRDTKEAIYVRHPDNKLQFLFLPKEAVIHMSKDDRDGLWTIEIPERLAEDKGLI